MLIISENQKWPEEGNGKWQNISLKAMVVAVNRRR
jgi:hypothetical protein